MQLLCTLRNHCRQWPRNTRYQADATPYLGRTSLPPAGSHQLCLAHSFDYLVGTSSENLIDRLPRKAIPSVPKLASWAPFAFVVDSFLVRAADYGVCHRDR